MKPIQPSPECPCGSGSTYDLCCGPVVRNERAARTAEELMRSRYTAYVVGSPDHLFRSWHPRTRPEPLPQEPDPTWRRLEILASTDEGETGTVEFRAYWTRETRNGTQDGVLHELSRFVRRAGRWVYLDGEIR